MLGEDGAEERKHVVAGEIGEWGELEGVVAAGETESARMGSVAPKRGEHLLSELGQHRRVVLTVDHEAIAAGTLTAFDVRHGTDGSPVVAEFVNGHLVAQAFPNVRGSHALTDNIGEIGGDMEEAAGADRFVMNQGDVSDGGADAGAEDAETVEALLLKPAEATAGVLNGLAVCLEGEANVRAADLVGTLVAAGHAAAVIRQTHLESGDAEPGDPFAKDILAVPFGVPVGENEESGAFCGLDWRTPGTGSRPKASVNGVVFRPG